MSKRVLITGGTGFIGRALCQRLLDKGYAIDCLSRRTSFCLEKYDKFRLIHSLDQLTPQDKPDWLINLAGEPILDRPWTQKRRAQLRDSRIKLTQSTIETLVQLDLVPKVMISGSAIGYYGDTGDQLITENSPVGHDFAAQLCEDWEQAAEAIKHSETRLCIIRTGLVLGKSGGMLARMKLPFQLGLGGKIGSGHQWMSWISLNDMCRLIIYLAETPSCSGVFNACSPNPCRNSEFTQLLGQQLNRPTLLSLPAALLKLGLGDAAALLLTGQHVIPERAIENGFQFENGDLKSTLANCLAN